VHEAIRIIVRKITGIRSDFFMSIICEERKLVQIKTQK
jgi:hypothetical protein